MSGGRSGNPLDVLVIGGGQAGLAMGYHLAQRGMDFQIVDAGSEIGAVWRSRWASLVLFTPAQYDNLPGMAFPAEHDSYPGKDDVAEYLQAYVAAYDLPVRLDTKVTTLSKTNGVYVAKAGDDAIEARQVVVATGPFCEPFVPGVAQRLSPDVQQVHSAEYQRPEEFPDGRVLVVGGANSGCQIAEELAATRRVDLSVGEHVPAIPQRPFGRDVWWWASGVRLDKVTAESRLGRRLSSRDPVIGPGPRTLAKRHGIQLRPRASDASGRAVTFEDGSSVEYDAVVWATGYRPDYSWIDVPDVKDERGTIRQTRGVTPSPGLFTVGLPWQHTRGSALLGWVGDDAAFVADRIEAARAG